MGSTRKRSGDGSGSRKKGKSGKSTKNKHQESQEDDRLPAPPPTVDTRAAGDVVEVIPPTVPVAAALMNKSPTRGRQPSIVGRQENGFVPMTEFEQRMTYQFLQVAEKCANLESDVKNLQLKFEQLQAEGAQLVPGKNDQAGNFYMALMDASNDRLPDIVDSWMLGMEAGGVLRTDDEASLPCFETKLPYHYAYALLSQEVETFLPLKKVMYHEMGVRETSERDACFRKYFEHRKTSKEPGPDDIPELRNSEGLLQKFQRLRRQAKNDKIGKPALAFVQTYGIKPHDSAAGWRTACDEGVDPLECFFFKTHHSREFYAATFRTTHPQVDAPGRTVISVAQLATLDQSVDTKAKSNQLKEEAAMIVKNMMLKAAASRSPSKKSPEKKTPEKTGTGRMGGIEKPASGDKRKGDRKWPKRASDGKKMAFAATGSIEAIKLSAASIAAAIWENHLKVTKGKKKKGREDDQPPGIAQPCECCWVVDVQCPGSPVTEMFQSFKDGRPGEDGRGVVDVAPAGAVEKKAKNGSKGGSDAGTDAGSDAGSGAASGAGSDAGSDGGSDGGSDVGSDVGSADGSEQKN